MSEKDVNEGVDGPPKPVGSYLDERYDLGRDEAQFAHKACWEKQRAKVVMA